MKKIVLLFVLLQCFSLLLANDAYLQEGGGSLVLQTENEKPEIIMQKEFVKIDLYEEYYKVSVEFSFFNDGSEKVVKVGFPNWGYGTSNQGIVQDFKAYTNGKEVAFTEYDDNFEQKISYFQIKKWFVRDVVFPSRKITNTRVEYKCIYGHSGFYKSVEYLFGTGSTWKDTIGEQVFKIVNHDEKTKYINDAYYDFKGKRIDLFNEKNDSIEIRNDKDGFIVAVKNICPKISDVIRFNISKSLLLFSPEFVDPGYVEENWTLSNKLFPKNQLMTMTDNQLFLLRNIIFAWHGNIFESKVMKRYLNENYANPEKKWKYWYKPDHKVQISELNEIELQNANSILNEEKRRKALK